ncbi:hypothetical protein P3L10_019309 [Capsicum annuum]
MDVLAHHSLTLDYVRGQCYDGASNMQSELGGLKTLIRQENRSAHSVHCFAHQLQLTLVAVSKRCVQVGEHVLLTSNILNVLEAFFKRVDEFQESQKEKLQKALDMGELETGRGLNQELGLIKASDTRWESHYKSFGNFIINFVSIVDVFDSLVENVSTSEEKASASGFLISCQTFETVFLLHWMTNVLGITNDLNVSLQKKEQDIANAMILRLQELNDRFNEVTRDFLNGVSCLNPIDTFYSFDIKKILVMAKLYPDYFDEFNMRVLENQLVNYIIDVCDIDKRFSNLGGLGKLSRKLVETKKHLSNPLVFLLVKFALLLPIVTASVERAFSAMKYIKNDLRNQMDNELLDGCIVPYVEKRVFKNISNECIIKTFQGMKHRRVHL